ncbi:HAD family hydrolase [Streptomyces griseoviridis]|uniref:HAD family phosphatase n=3 Tax=Streptomyces TaxID=1883 RepID=A0A3Q9KPY6_STRGD|nr:MULTISPECIES: HAD family phosphatase [Streptomyces]AZS83035.1 HAD family phosphatase [Streptomyces griseoviridis]MDH6695748.1 beta-phosphoglucomutase-like phosphatase (HAD superfamily) [Streptomyces sp. MAA16]MDT0470614.1 HAD family phosphatase [Streptomyces sp. DSM 41014]QCN90113.1 hydrolase [Streptomyces griseoviridis]
MTTQASSLLHWSPQAVVFDCDGTLMDTERHWQDARTRAFQSFGLTTPPGFADRAKGVHYIDCGRLMAEEVQKPELTDVLTKGLLDHFLDLVTDDPATMPGAAEFVRLLSGRLPLAVASNCPLEVVEESLGRAGLRRHFEHIVVPTDATRTPDATPAAAGAKTVRPKPWPDVYATAARLCGAAPETALAIEDSLTGVESARRAGLRVLGVGPRPAEQDAARADLWVTALNDPDLLTWVREHVL